MAASNKLFLNLAAVEHLCFQESKQNSFFPNNTLCLYFPVSSPPDNLSGVPVNESAISLDWNDVKGLYMLQ